MTSRRLNELAACPQCLGDMDCRQSEYHCPNCEANYPITNGLPEFSQKSDNYTAPLSQLQFKELLEKYRPLKMSENNNWKNFADELVHQIKNDSDKKYWVGNLFDESLTYYKYLTSLKPDGCILNFGCGWDNCSVNMARFAGSVTAIDLSAEQLTIQQFKKQFYQLDNLDLLIGGNSPHLPFKNNSFDLVVLNFSSKLFKPGRGLLKNKNAVMDLLKEIRRVLTEDGEVFLGADNLYNRSRFYSNANETYTNNQYRQSLAKTGFDQTKFYAVEPSAGNPQKVVDLNSKKQISNFLNSVSTRVRYFPRWLYKKTVPTYAIIASGGISQISWVEGAVNQLAQSLKLEKNQIEINNSFITRKNKMIFSLNTKNSENRKLLLKIPMTPDSCGSTRHNHNCLTLLKKETALRNLIPEPIGEYEYHNQKYFVESFVKGRPVNKDLEQVDFKFTNQSIIKLLNNFKHIPVENYQTADEKEQWHKKIDFLKNHKLLSEGRLKDKLELLTTEISAVIESKLNQPKFRKNDFSLSNIYLDNNKIVGLIDFDEWSFSSLPLLDYTDFLYSTLRQKYHFSWEKAVASLYKNDYDLFPAILEIEQTIEKLGGTKPAMSISAVASWLDHVYNSMLSEIVFYDYNRVKHLLVKPLEQFELKEV